MPSPVCATPLPDHCNRSTDHRTSRSQWNADEGRLALIGSDCTDAQQKPGTPDNDKAGQGPQKRPDCHPLRIYGGMRRIVRWSTWAGEGEHGDQDEDQRQDSARTGQPKKQTAKYSQQGDAAKSHQERRHFRSHSGPCQRRNHNAGSDKEQSNKQHAVTSFGGKSSLARGTFQLKRRRSNTRQLGFALSFVAVVTS
jgi:hypothetical protein